MTTSLALPSAENAIKICLPNSNASALPCDVNDQDEVACFYQDNPHIKTPFIARGTPYIYRPGVGKNPRPWDELRPDLLHTFRQLHALPADTRRNIAAMNQTYGSELLVALSEFHRNEIAPMVSATKEYNRNTIAPTLIKESGGLTGAGVAALSNRLSAFSKSVIASQQKLEQVREAFKAKVPKLELLKFEQAAKNQIKDMNVKFQAELTKYMGNAKASARGTPWSNPDRAINIAKSSRTTTPIELYNAKEMQMVKDFGLVGKLAGPGLLIIDTGIRVGNVHLDYLSGKDWQRSLVTEATSFGLSGIAGTAGGSVGATLGAAAISFLNVGLLATPTGWLLVIGTALAMGYGSAKLGDWFGKISSGTIYDISSKINWF
ncbi:hypothetical protein SG34_008755 [Thalassomonas viridans]|uniref:Uncharacterized protein n=1 Tax=Thalassomonas viridans TaxID=137584 RepID=A0AAF0CAW0_9GAMM|nr:hypothetical protein [Thalassomonas viridans]WDE06961.1 hypothetical protein SG34_008755 [Thalassomonas viridans]